MAGSLNRAVEARIRQAANTWKQVNRKISRNKALSPMIRILLWNSPIRGTMIYGLRTKDIPGHIAERMEIYIYMSKHIRTIACPNWKPGEWYPAKPTLQETATVVDGIMDQQDADNYNDGADARNQTIHPRDCNEMLMPRMKMRQQWGKRHQSTLEHANGKKTDKTDRKNYMKTRKTELVKYIADRPEMPTGMELSRDDREKLAEITIEYPTRKSTQEHARQGLEQQEQK